MKHVILSAPARGDILAAYRWGLAKYWPDCPFPDIEVVDSPTDTGWSKRFLTYVNSISDDIIYCTIDDLIVSAPTDTVAVEEALRIMKADPKIGVFRLASSKPTELELVPGRWGKFDEKEPKFKRTLLGLSFFRTAFLRIILGKIIEALTPEQDNAWIGAYNYELFGGYFSVGIGWDAASSVRRDWPIATVNLVQQGKLYDVSANVLQNAGYDISELKKRGIYNHRDNPYVEAWSKAPRK